MPYVVQNCDKNILLSVRFILSMPFSTKKPLCETIFVQQNYFALIKTLGVLYDKYNKDAGQMHKPL